MRYIVNKDDFEQYNVGTKAFNLFMMQKNCIKVPNLFCISSDYMSECLQEEIKTIEKILEGIDFSSEGSIVSGSNKIQQIINILHSNDAFLEEVLKSTKQYLHGVDNFSIRSSSSVEDGMSASFAGQFATYLDVSEKDIILYVVKCFASLYDTNVLKYCHQKKISFSLLHMNVIIQEMINSELSGIVFTANPQGVLNESVIVVGAGVGENVVKDLVQTTSYYYNLTDRVYYYERQDGAPLLSEEIISRILNIAVDLKTLFGEWLDIEYAVKDDEIFILQARPITALNVNAPLILDNSNIVESYPGITLPLTDSFINFAYTSVFKGLAYRCLKNKRILNDYDKVFCEMIGSVNGRIYYKISNWYTVIKFLPFSKKIIPVWQEMLGVSNKQYEEEKNMLSIWQRIRLYCNAVYEAFNVQKGMKKLNQDFLIVQTHFTNEYKEGMPNDKLLILYEDIKEKILKDWDITLLNDMYAFVFTGLLKSKFKQLGIENYEMKTNQYISGIANIESMKPITALLNLTKLAVNSGVLQSLKSLESADKVYLYIHNIDTVFTSKFKQYINEYGDRSLEELKLESKTFRSDPSLLVKKILEYAEDPEKLEAMINTLEKSQSGSNDVRLQNTSLVNRLMIRFFGRKATKGICNREVSRLNRSRVYGMVRSIFLSIGNNLVKDHKIENKEDIFYLNTNEVFDMLKGKTFEVKEIIKNRKHKYELFKLLPAYSRLVFAGSEFNKNHSNVNQAIIKGNKNDITGTPCSNGVVTGEVVVIDNPNDAVRLKDKILVTKTTDPGWVFLLSVAKGVIAEKGSLLSHTAIISRELGIPSIVGVIGITNILKTGDVIQMDGSTGKIEIIG